MTKCYDLPEVEEVIFHWSRTHGDCYDCGRPAAFEGDLYYNPNRGHRRDDWEILCAVCAANHAAAGVRIKRIEPLT